MHESQTLEGKLEKILRKIDKFSGGQLGAPSERASGRGLVGDGGVSGPEVWDCLGFLVGWAE